MGRTGTFSVAEHYAITPDLITLAKSLGSGVPVGATLVSDTLAGQVQYGDHGSTFGGGMLAMAAVEATLKSIVEEDLMGRARSHLSRRAGHSRNPIAARCGGAAV